MVYGVSADGTYSTLCVVYLVCYLYTALEQQPVLSSTNRAVTRGKGMAEGATARTVHYLLSYTSCHRRGSVFTLQVHRQKEFVGWAARDRPVVVLI